MADPGQVSVAPEALPQRLRIRPRSAVMIVAMLGATLMVLRAAAAAERVLGWVLVAVVAALLLQPVVSALPARLPRGLRVLMVMIGLTALLGVIGYGLFDDIRRETDRLKQVAPERAEQLERSDRFGATARDLQVADRTREFLDKLPEHLRGGTPAEAIRAAATRGVAYLTTAILTIFLMLHGPRILNRAALEIADESRRARIKLISANVYQRAFGYCRSSIAMALAAGLFAFLAARIADVPGAAPLGVWVGLWDLIPVAGAVVGALPIVALAAISSPGDAVALSLVFVAYQLVENLVVARRVEARTVHVGPFLTLAGGIVGFELSGVTGALLAILLVTVVVTVADETASAA